MNRFSRTRAVLTAEWDAVRRRDPDLDPGEVTAFTLPLLGWAALVAAVGVLPIVVLRMGDGADEMLLPLVSSIALATICSAVVTWITAIVISALLTVIVYGKPARGASRLAVGITRESFGRINDATSNLMLLALVVGLIALAFRNAADVIDDQSPALAWPWALLVVAASWVLASVVGPLEFTAMVRRLLEEWLPSTVGDVPATRRSPTCSRPGPGGSRRSGHSRWSRWSGVWVRGATGASTHSVPQAPRTSSMRTPSIPVRPSPNLCP